MKHIYKADIMRKVLFILLVFGVQASSMAQTKEEMKRAEKMESLRIAYLTQELDLSTDESQDFWPIYNEYHKELKKIREGMRRPENGLADVSEQEAAQLIEQRFNFETQKLALEKEFVQDLEGVISKRKTARLLMAEEKFKKEMLGRIKERMKERQGGPRGGAPMGGGPRGNNRNDINH